MWLVALCVGTASCARVLCSSKSTLQLAIVVDSYAAVKEDIGQLSTANNIFHDCWISFVHAVRSLVHGWPSVLLKKVQNSIVIEAMRPTHLQHALGISEETAKSIIHTYFELSSKAADFTGSPGTI